MTEGAGRRRARKPAAAGRRSPGKRWSQKVTETSHALDLERGVFALDDPREVAKSLRRSDQASRRRKADPFRSATRLRRLARFAVNAVEFESKRRSAAERRGG